MATDKLTKFCVTHDQRTKLITVSSDGGILKNLKAKISTKFGLDTVTFKIKHNDYENLIDIDESDADDVQLIEQGGNVFLDTPKTCPVAPSDTPSADISTDDDLEVASTSSCISLHSRAENGSKCFNVTDIIHRHPRGRDIDQEYNTNKTITTETRRLLTSIVCAEMVKIFTYYPTKEQKIKVAQSIIQAYPTLRSSTQVPYDIWFDPCDSNRGYLSQKLNTMRRHLPRNEMLKPRMKEGGKKILTPTTAKTTKRKYTPLEEIPPLEEKELMLFL